MNSSMKLNWRKRSRRKPKAVYANWRLEKNLRFGPYTIGEVNEKLFWMPLVKRAPCLEDANLHAHVDGRKINFFVCNDFIKLNEELCVWFPQCMKRDHSVTNEDALTLSFNELKLDEKQQPVKIEPPETPEPVINRPHSMVKLEKPEVFPNCPFDIESNSSLTNLPDFGQLARNRELGVWELIKREPLDGDVARCQFVTNENTRNEELYSEITIENGEISAETSSIESGPTTDERTTETFEENWNESTSIKRKKKKRKLMMKKKKSDLLEVENNTNKVNENSVNSGLLKFTLQRVENNVWELAKPKNKNPEIQRRDIESLPGPSRCKDDEQNLFSSFLNPEIQSRDTESLPGPSRCKDDEQNLFSSFSNPEILSRGTESLPGPSRCRDDERNLFSNFSNPEIQSIDVASLPGPSRSRNLFSTFSRYSFQSQQTKETNLKDSDDSLKLTINKNFESLIKTEENITTQPSTIFENSGPSSPNLKREISSPENVDTKNRLLDTETIAENVYNNCEEIESDKDLNNIEQECLCDKCGDIFILNQPHICQLEVKKKSSFEDDPVEINETIRDDNVENIETAQVENIETVQAENIETVQAENKKFKEIRLIKRKRGRPRKPQYSSSDSGIATIDGSSIESPNDNDINSISHRAVNLTNNEENDIPKTSSNIENPRHPQSINSPLRETPSSEDITAKKVGEDAIGTRRTSRKRKSSKINVIFEKTTNMRIKEQKKFKCKLCSKTFPLKAYLLCHQQLEHQRETKTKRQRHVIAVEEDDHGIQNTPKENEEKKRKRGRPRKEEVVKMKRQESPGKSEIKVNDTNRESKKQTFSCNKCHKKFRFVESLDFHTCKQ